MEPIDGHCFGIIGNVPRWFYEFCLMSHLGNKRLGKKKFPFLHENFNGRPLKFWMEITWDHHNQGYE